MTGEDVHRDPAEFRITVLAVALMMATAAVHQVSAALVGRRFNAAVAAILTAGIVGIIRKVRWGRLIGVIFLWGSIVVGFGTLSPYRADDLMAAGINVPSLAILVIRFAGVCAVSLLCLHYLGKHKLLFRRAWI